MEVNIIFRNNVTSSVTCYDGDNLSTNVVFVEAELEALVTYMMTTYFNNATFIIDKNSTTTVLMIIEHPLVPTEVADLQLNIKSTGKYKPVLNYFTYIQNLIV